MVTDAIKDFRQRGSILDFNLAENCIVCNSEKFLPGDFEVVDVCRYEANGDPAVSLTTNHLTTHFDKGYTRLIK